MDYNTLLNLFNSGNVPELTVEEINRFFRLSCVKEHLVAKWLWEISDHKINIHAYDDIAFHYSCVNGNFVVAKWLWIISKHTIAFSVLKEYYAELTFLNMHSIKKYKYNYTNTYDNLHMIHHYYKPVDGPGYLNAINDFL